MQRQLAANTILILDGMNYIKGFRYQLHCAVREAKLRSCTVGSIIRGIRRRRNWSFQLYVVASQDQCCSWNEERPPIQSYSPETSVIFFVSYFRQVLTPPSRLKSLVLRFEEPSSMVRWDSPLFTVMWSDENMPYEDIWNAITRGNVKPPNTGTVAVRL